MRMAIITVCYNSQRTISRTIGSVLAQDFADIEYLIIYGVSLDKTVSIVKAYCAQFVKKGVLYVLQSESDKGIYDTMNKGV